MGRTVVLALAMLLAAATARADDFYKGKTVTIDVGFSAGGGFDMNARLLARHLGKYIPGTPEVIVVNVPGAASRTSIVRLDAVEPKDGTVIDTFNFGLIGDALLEPNKTPIDFRNYAWIGSISDDLTVCYLWRAGGPVTLAEVVNGKQLTFGLTGLGTSEDINTKILIRVFGAHVRQVAGYPGSADIRIAIERGELDGDCGAWSSVPVDWTGSAKFHPFARSGRSTPPGMPVSIPYIVDAAPNAQMQQLVRFLLADSEVGRPFVVSKSVPAERVRILRAAFTAAVKDKDFLADAAKLNLPVEPKSGAEAAQAVAALYATSPDVVAAARKIVQ